MVTLDLRPSEVTIQFLRGGTLACTLYYLDATGAVVDLVGHTGKLKVVDPNTLEEIVGWSIDLPIVTGNTTYEGKVVVDAQGVYIEVPPTVTAQTGQDYLNFECLLIDANLRVTPIAYGVLVPSGL